MGLTVSDIIWKRLHEWAIDRVFGYPGDIAAGLLDALERSAPALTFIQTRHQEAAAFMAVGHAKFSGSVGVCLATTGSGLIHLLNGLCDAHLDHIPVIAIIGGNPRQATGGHARIGLDLRGALREVAGAFVETILTPDQAAAAVDAAMRATLLERRVACLVVPADLQEETACETEDDIGASIGPERPALRTSEIPHEGAIRNAAQLLNGGRRVAMLVGAGGLDARNPLIATAERLGAGVAKTILGKAALPDDLPFVTGTVGLLGTKPSQDMLQACDTLLTVGTTFPYRDFLPQPDRTRVVQIDLNPSATGFGGVPDVRLVGDSGAILESLLPHLTVRPRTTWRSTIEASVADWWNTVEAEAQRPARFVHPGRVMAELSAIAPKNCLITADIGSVVQWYARGFRIRPGMKASLSGALASMGAGIPYALAGKFAYPDRPAIVVIGDGAMQMSGLNELITVAEHWRRWANPHFIVLVLNNASLSNVTWERRLLNGPGRRDTAPGIATVAYHQFATMLGLRALYVTRPEALASAWQDAFSADRPVLLEVRTDPEISPLPPHISADEARLLARHMAGYPRKHPPDASSLTLNN